MKLVLIQKNISNPDLKGMLTKAAELKPDLAIACELAFNGCVYQPRELPSLEKFEQEIAGFPFDIFAGAAVTTNNRPFNSYIHYHDGIKHLYHKVNLFEPFNETTVYQPGKDVGIWETDFGRVGVAICYDLRFDNLFEQMKEAQVDLIVIPAAWPQVRNQVYRELSIKRAKDCEAFVICVNAVGHDELNLFGGKSAVISPEGEVLAEADETTEILVECEI